MDIQAIAAKLGLDEPITKVTQFCAEEDARPYQVWKIETKDRALVLKQTTQDEMDTYETFLTQPGLAPQVYAFNEFDGQLYMLMEFIPGSSMSFCTRPRLQQTLDTLIASQKKYWEDRSHSQSGYSFEKSWPNRCKRLAYMGDLKNAYQAYLDCFASIPRTLCNDDMLPFNVLASDDRAVILDWEFAGILPYPCALARFLAFGEEVSGEMFYMTAEDRQFALDYYFENLVKSKGITRPEFDRTMQLFFFKEYSEWIYCAAISGEPDMEYAQKYRPIAQKLAKELGF